ncbi:MAG: tRNA (N(6)-L-threonylcarbamoyladenosine(37)-C(2))-methylthiotransferase [Thermoplasmatales archaeon]|nr:MAG: tRNA (N(6)-L-threonylcarbamoyladenosine(37)-C(2))-methylthiotransferase [Thermoplasmatales archaeon]
MNIYLETYGCTANKSDESVIRGILKKENHEIVESSEKADILILLTCTVIGTTEQRMLSRMQALSKTNKKIVVAGCMPSVQPDLIKSIVPNAFLVPPQYLYHINDIILEKEINFEVKNKTLSPKNFNGISAPISIAEGCTLSCSYCITHFARGKLRSFPIEEVSSDVYNALKQGCKEIQITAQDTASYGFDTGDNLGNLLFNICKIKGNFRIRVGMMNPFTAQKNLEGIVSAYENPKIYKFLHLPVQSGDNNLLKQMNRKYTVEDFLEIVDKFREKYPNLTLSTDVIVGFPTETERQINRTARLLKKVKPDIVNITRYSARPLTKAKTMKGRVSTKLAKERSKYLTEVCSTISKEKNKEHKGKKYTVLITKKVKNDTFVGRAENYKPVITNEKVEIGESINLKIVDSDSIHLFGKLI